MKAKIKMELDELTKGNIWTITESELSQMIIEGKKEDHYAEYQKHYNNIIRTVFDIQYLNRDDDKRVAQLEAMRYQIFSYPNEGNNNAIAIRKHPLKKVTDLTMENISHLEPYEVLKLIENNLGTGWKGLPLAVQDIIESAFFVDCTVLPTITMHRAGGIIDRRKEDGYDVLELTRGTWTEAVFIKPKPRVEKQKLNLFITDDKDDKSLDDDDDDNLPEIEEEEEDDDDEDLPEIEDEDPDRDEDDDIDLDSQAPDISDLEDIEDMEDVDDDDE